MSIKKLFDSVDKNLQYQDYKTQKEAFEPVESARNAAAVQRKQDTFVPDIDYTEPANFAKYGSAFLYYSGAINRIIDFYPYDGSLAEKNEFYNNLYPVEKYIFDKRYPKSTGYVIMSANGWGSAVGSMSDGYGMPSTQEYITFKGGPGVRPGGGNTLVDKSPNQHSDRFQYSNIYDTDIYTTEGLPSDYGKGARASNLQANFDTGVTVEFWLKKPAFDTSKTVKEVIFDLWNSGSTGDGDYGRLTIEVDAEASGSPFRITAQSGSTPTGIFEKTIGTSPTVSSLSDWNHYALSFQNSGSNFVTKLFLNGYLDATNTYTPDAATATVTITTAGAVSHGDTFTLVDASGTSTTYLINGGGAWDSQTAQPAGGTVHVMIGGAGGGVAGKVRISAAINSAINLTTGAGFSSVTNGVDNVTITQSTAGLAGNKTNTDSIGGATVTNFTGGAIYTLGEITLNTMFGRIGGLLAAPNTLSASAGAGKLSASMDEFRYWKVARDSKQIVEHWYSHVGGGTNTDISNTTLGVYYKFNEGITGTGSTDSVVLDYAGRATNGAWTNYSAVSRNTGSAIVSASASRFEKQDPIMRSNNIRFKNLKTELFASGNFYDSTNNSAFINYAPSWVIEKHEKDGNTNLKNIAHLMGAYFDQMYLLTQQMPSLRHFNYTSASSKPLPFAHHLPQSLGLYTSDLFINASILERFEDRNEKELFESKLNEAKDLIYLNLYNNLTHIYKAKGTSKSIRNVLRCFYLDDSLVNLNTYAKNSTYSLQNNITQKLIEDTHINFNEYANTGAVLYQAIDSSNPYSRGYISGTMGSVGTALSGAENRYGCTVEADITFPIFFSQRDKFPRTFTTMSLFGVRGVNTGSVQSLSGTDTTYTTGSWGGTYDLANFQVLAIRDAEYSKNVYFKLTSSIYPNTFPVLTSSVFYGVYDNSQWNLSVRIKPTTPLAELVTGALGTQYNYNVIFRGINTYLGTVQDSFELTGALNFESGSYFLRFPKRLYAGAQRANLTGALEFPTDVLFDNLKYWSKHIDNTSINQHLFDPENAGVSGSYRNISIRDPHSDKYDLLNSNMLALNWNFQQVTASNASGIFRIEDHSSGSAQMSSTSNYGWIGGVTGYQHTGYAKHFGVSSQLVRQKELTNMYKFVDPEKVVGDNMINLISKTDLVYGVDATLPDFVYTVEKSQFSAISEEMLQFFAGVLDFNDLIGAPVNRYRERYKDLEFLRQAFYRRVNSLASVEKYLDYYKWFDDAISEIISQMVPASSDFIEGVLNTIEPTVLDRPKYKTAFPTLEQKPPEPEAAMTGESFINYPGRFGSRPAPQLAGPSSAIPIGTLNTEYWKERAQRTDPVVSTARFGLSAAKAAVLDAQREKIRKVVVSSPYLSRSQAPTFFDEQNTSYYTGQDYRILALGKLQKIEADPGNVTFKAIKGGTNFTDTKANIEFVYSALHPQGPVNQEGGNFVPQNILIGFLNSLVKLPYDNDPKLPTEKIKRYLKVLHGRNAIPGRDSTSGQEYEDSMKSSYVFPFNVMSSSLTFKSGYQKHVLDVVSASVDITNLHHDTYGPDNEIPMQGPFTDYAVGGHQSRHVRVNYQSPTHPLDNWKTRPEAWKILLGTCLKTLSGAIGMVGPDYPTPVWNGYPDEASKDPKPYPLSASQKAVYFRDLTAKSPVNIKNIRIRTGSTILGNYTKNYDVVQAPGAFSNPRHWVRAYRDGRMPTLPAVAFQQNATGTLVINTFLDMPRGHRSGTVPYWPHNLNTPSSSYFTFVPDYSTSYLTGNTSDSVMITRFAANGGAEVMSRGHQDFKSAEYSVYNTLNFRNLPVKKPGQGPRGTYSIRNGIRAFDIHGNDYGLTSHLARHTARFGRDSLAFPHTDADRDPYDLTKPFVGYSMAKAYRANAHLQGWWRLRTPSLTSSGDATDYSGRGRNGTFDASADRPSSYSATIYPSKFVQTASLAFNLGPGTPEEKVNIGTAATWNNLIGNGNPSTRQMTIAAWVYKVADGGSGGGLGGKIIDFGDGDIGLYTDGNERVWFFVKWNGTAVYWATAQNAVVKDAWTHVAVTYNAWDTGNVPRMYINGAEVDFNKSPSSTPVDPYSGIVTEACYIANDASDGNDFEGHLADVAVWNKTLEYEDIVAIYNASRLEQSEYSGLSRGPGASAITNWQRYQNATYASIFPQYKYLDKPPFDYQQPPGFHKVHRNNLKRWKPKTAYGSHTWFEGIENKKYINFDEDDTGGSPGVGTCLTVGDEGVATSGASAREDLIFDAKYGKSAAGNVVSFSWQCWIKLAEPGTPDYRQLFLLGQDNTNPPSAMVPVHELYKAGSGHIVYKMTNWNGSVAGSRTQTTWVSQDIALTSSAWQHVGFSMTTTHGACDSTTVPLLVVDGREFPFASATPSTHLVSGSETQPNFRNSGTGYKTPVIFFGRSALWQSREMHGGVDEMAMWSGLKLNLSQFTELYNNGVPCNLTASSTVGSSNLIAWWRMGDGYYPGDGSDSIAIASGDNCPAWAFGSMGKIVDVKAGKYELCPVARVGSVFAAEISTAAPLGGCPDITYSYPFTGISAGYYSSSVFDNYWIQHAIPRSSKQYAWITASGVNYNDTQFVGYTPASFEIDNLVNGVPQGTKNAYTFVSCSDFGRYYQTSTGTKNFGWIASRVAAGANVEQFIPVDFVGLNTVIVDPIDPRTNTVGAISYFTNSYTDLPVPPGSGNPVQSFAIGRPTAGVSSSAWAESKAYINSAFAPRVNTEGSGAILNSLLLNRGNAYAGASWQRTPGRMTNHPIIRHERKTNTLSMFSLDPTPYPLLKGQTPDQRLRKFKFYPVNQRAKICQANFNNYSQGESFAGGGAGTAPTNDPYTLEFSHENEGIYFSDPELNDQFQKDMDYYKYITPFEMFLQAIAQDTPGGLYKPSVLDDGTWNVNAQTNHLNWIIWNQQVFPSVQNDYSSSARIKKNHTNRFWADSRTTRNNKAAISRDYLTSGLENPVTVFPLDWFDNNYSGSVNSLGQIVQQSSWPLDAPDNFLTRTRPAEYLSMSYGPNGIVDPGGPGLLGKRWAAYRGWTGSAGELQNSYTNFFTGSRFSQMTQAPDDEFPGDIFYNRLLYSTLGSLYARKHLMSNPRSVVARTGPSVPQTGARWYTPMTPEPGGLDLSRSWSNAQWLTGNWATYNGAGHDVQHRIGAGEALWEAGLGAGVVRLNIQAANQSVLGPALLTKPNYIFEKTASNPWFNDYDEFNEVSELIAKDYSIVPEYRMSDYVSKYADLRTFGDSIELTVPDAYENPNNPTTVVNSISGNLNFWLDYSNGEFLKDADMIYQETGMFPTEIQLSAEAIIGFNPSKGFYPAQRTLDLVEQFRKSYAKSITTKISKGKNANLFQTLDFEGGEGSGSIFYPSMYPIAGGAPLSARPLANALFAPGILYNSIKSGMAVDYPIVSDARNMRRAFYTTQSEGGRDDLRPFHISGCNNPNTTQNNYALTFGGVAAPYAFSWPATGSTQTNKDFFTKRIPFEAMLAPAQLLDNTRFLDMESHPSASQLFITCSFQSDGEDGTYTKMAQNFFGQVGSFFLEGGDFTSLKSKVMFGTQQFPPGRTYVSRVKMRRSFDGERNYISESVLSTLPLKYDGAAFVNRFNFTHSTKQRYGSGVNGGSLSDQPAYILYYDGTAKYIGFGSLYVPTTHAIWFYNTGSDAEPTQGFTGNQIKVDISSTINNRWQIAGKFIEAMQSASDAGLIYMPEGSAGKIRDIFTMSTAYVEVTASTGPGVRVHGKSPYYVDTGNRNGYLSTSLDVHMLLTGTAYVNPYGRGGGRPYAAQHSAAKPEGAAWSFTSGAFEGSGSRTDAGAAGTFPLPQDPIFSNLKENFTMYSRASAFGPDISGRYSNIPISKTQTTYGPDPDSGLAPTTYKTTITYQPRFGLDCFEGFNWAYTPPYYNGEAWADLIFRPSASTDYDLQRIMAETKVVYWRHDAGMMSGSSDEYPRGGWKWYTPHTRLVDGQYYRSMQSDVPFVPLTKTFSRTPYGGNAINRSAMQISAAINLFGVEDAPFTEVTLFPPGSKTRNQTVGQRWVIKPKFETPMMNFADRGVRPLTASANPGTQANYTNNWLSIPSYASASVPRGMWHQFGVIEPDPAKGIFLEIADIPEDWMKKHYLVVETGSIYNNWTKRYINGEVYMPDKDRMSLTSLLGFGGSDDRPGSQKLGKLAESRKVKEALLVIPYTVEEGVEEITSEVTFNNKSFISIPEETYQAAIAEGVDVSGDTLDTAGSSVRQLVSKMANYIIPPQLDFVNNPKSVDPCVMYFIEFEVEFDQDDLSYIWQNLAPRKFKQNKKKRASTAHYVMNTELLNRSLLVERGDGTEEIPDDGTTPSGRNEIRWLVMKVKQRAQTKYSDLVPEQVAAVQASSTPFGVKAGTAADLMKAIGGGSHINKGTSLNTAQLAALKARQTWNVKKEQALFPVEALEGSGIPFDDRYQFNWPYDYLSLVEKVKIDVSIKHEWMPPTMTPAAELIDDPELMNPGPGAQSAQGAVRADPDVQSVLGGASVLGGSSLDISGRRFAPAGNFRMTSPGAQEAARVQAVAGGYSATDKGPGKYGI